jgi:hypothetical protein
MIDSSPVKFREWGIIMGFQVAEDASPTIVNSPVARTREYLTAAETETLMVAARKSSRYGHRDAVADGPKPRGLGR